MNALLWQHLSCRICECGSCVFKPGEVNSPLAHIYERLLNGCFVQTLHSHLKSLVLLRNSKRQHSEGTGMSPRVREWTRGWELGGSRPVPLRHQLPVQQRAQTLGSTCPAVFPGFSDLIIHRKHREAVRYAWSRAWVPEPDGLDSNLCSTTS